MAYYKPKTETGNEYVFAMREFYLYTLNKCMKLPQRWYDTILKPVIEPVERARANTIKANKIYVNLDKQNQDEIKSAIDERDNYLYKALEEFAVFDIAFDTLTSYIDIENYEKLRMRNKLENIINTIKNENPDTKNIDIKLEYRENELSLVSLAGKDSTRLKITPKNLEYWVSLENQAENKIKDKILKDKQYLKST